MRKLLLLIVVLFISEKSQAENKSYVLISFSNCTFCNNSLRIFHGDDNFISSSVLLGSAEDANIKQLKSLAVENFQINFKGYQINTKLFNNITAGIFYKMPCFAILNSDNKILFKTTVDSVVYYKQTIGEYLSPKTKISKLKPVKNARLSEIGGYSSIEVFADKVGISYFNKSDRIYFLDTKLNKLDSLYFSNDEVLLEKLFKMAGETESDPHKVIDFANRNDLPYDLHHFGSLSLNGDYLTTTDDLLYADLRDTIEILYAKWKPFVISISISKKTINFLSTDQWHDSITKPNQFKNFDFNDQLYQKESDSTWLISSKKLIPDNPTDLNLYMVRFKANSEDKLIPIGMDSFPKLAFKDFNGKSLNKPNFIIPFEYSKELLYFNESPSILVNNEWIDVKKSISSINWIYDVELNEQGNLLTLVIREHNNDKSLVYYDLSTRSVINKILLPKFEAKSNVQLSNNMLSFLDSNGTLNRYLISK